MKAVGLTVREVTKRNTSKILPPTRNRKRKNLLPMSTILQRKSQFDGYLTWHRIGAATITVAQALDTMFSSDVAQVQALHKIMEQLMMRKQKAEEVVWELLMDVLFLRTGNGAAELLAYNGFLLNGEKHQHSSTSGAAATAAAANSLLRSGTAPGSAGVGTATATTTTTTTGASVTANTPTSAGAGSGKDHAAGADGNNTVASTDSKAIAGAKAGGTRTSTSSTSAATAAAADAKYLLHHHHHLHHPQHGMTNPFLAKNMRFALEEDLKVESMQEEFLQQQLFT